MIRPSLHHRQRVSFTFIIDTRNTSSGSSSANQFRLPVISSGSYDCTVFWGDGSSSRVTSWFDADLTHTYASEGIYIVEIYGKFMNFQFNNAGDRLKLTEVVSYGDDFSLSSASGAFFGCGNLTRIPNDKPPGVQSNYNSFIRNCTSLVGFDPSDWDVSAITSMSNFASGTGAIFASSVVAACYTKWSLQSVQSGVTVSFSSSKYDASGQAGRDVLDNAPNNWTIFDGGVAP